MFLGIKWSSGKRRELIFRHEMGDNGGWRRRRKMC
jgi:hypothetical protein